MKVKTHYVCQSCGASSARWLGRCPGCEEWNTLVEEKVSASSGAVTHESSMAAVRSEFKSLKKSRDLPTPAGGRRAERDLGDWVPLDDGPDENAGEIDPVERRYATGLEELDRVLGGGLVPDSFILLGGDPGIGKSTLLLQMARGVLEQQPDLKLLYVSGEESITQIRSRARRLGVKGEGRVFLASETQLERVFANIKELAPDVIVMDSLQTFSSGSLESAPGSVSQVREIAARLMALAKSAGIAIWLVGHVTKDGNIAGPKVVEHMVDTVLYFEGDNGQTYRLLRTVKNRFGSTRELGVFEMESEGLREVSNPSALFLSERPEPVAGTATATSLEGSRPLLVELQALVVPSGLAVPRRTAVGMDGSRVSLIAAILERHMRLRLAQNDLFFNVAGGLRLSEPACDLAAAAAIWSSSEETPFPPGWIFIGELGLTGEVRRVGQLDARLREAAKLGFTTAVVPRAAMSQLRGESVPGMKLLGIDRIAELPRVIRPGGKE